MHSGDGRGLDEAAEVFADQRSRLFGIAYRMLGAAGEAEDIVQEAWVRWQTTDRTAVRDPAAFLATTTTRLAINVLRSARVRRETYVGPWLPEPVDTGADPAAGAERGEVLELAVLFLLERLSPTERAAYGRRRQLLRRRGSRTRRGADPRARPYARGEVRHGVRTEALAGRDGHVGRGERPAGPAGLAR